MKNPQKGAANVAVIVAVVILIGIIAYFAFNNKDLADTSGTNTQVQTDNSAMISQDEALALVKSTWGNCDAPDSCSSVAVSVKKDGATVLVTATYEGLKDDSVSAQIKQGAAQFQNGAWVLREPTVTHRCQIGRGHQTFSTEPCI